MNDSIDRRLARMLARPESWAGDESVPGSAAVLEALVLQLLEIRAGELNGPLPLPKTDRVLSRYRRHMAGIPAGRPGNTPPSSQLSIQELAVHLATFVAAEQMRELSR